MVSIFLLLLFLSFTVGFLCTYIYKLQKELRDFSSSLSDLYLLYYNKLAQRDEVETSFFDKIGIDFKER